MKTYRATLKSALSLVEAAEPADPRAGVMNAGLWSVYNGGLVTCTRTIENAEGYLETEVIHYAVDLSTLTLPEGNLPALRDHQEWQPVGHWSDLATDGATLNGRFFAYVPDKTIDGESAPLYSAHEVAALAARGFPWQASIGAAGGDWASLPPGESIEINGQTVTAPDDGVPTFIHTNAHLREVTVCLFGADSDTGKVAASEPAGGSGPKPQGNTMSDQDRRKALFSRLGAEGTEAAHLTRAGHIVHLMDGGKSDDEIVDAMNAEDDKAKDDKIADLEGQIETLTADLESANERLAALTDGDNDNEEGDGEGEPVGAAAGAAGQTVATLADALRVMAPELKGLDMAAKLSAVKVKYPDLDLNK